MIKLNKDNYIIYDDGRVWSKNAGRFVGSLNKADGYWSCSIEGKGYKVHRLVWEKFRGEIPTHLEIDHINDDRGDNRLENLQLLTPSENSAKRQKLDRNTSGFIGVSLHKNSGKWVAENRNNGVYKYLGLFDSPEEAARARDDFIIKNGFKHHRLNFPSRRLNINPSINRLEKFKSPSKKGFLGIWLDKSRNNWAAENSNNGKKKSLGRFNSAFEAAKARDAFIIKNGFNNPLNFPCRRLNPIINRLEKIKSPLKSGFIGVSFDKNSGKWQAYFKSKEYNNGKKKFLGYFKTAIEAARARDAFIIKNNLKHRLNFPQ